MNNIISKTITTIAFAAGSAFVTFIVYYIWGTILGNILHSSHEQHYECVCDQAPILTILEGCILGVMMQKVALGLKYKCL